MERQAGLWGEFLMGWINGVPHSRPCNFHAASIQRSLVINPRHELQLVGGIRAF